MTSFSWQNAVFYQIYPRSFHDANGDGVGDLAGITAKLDYVASLGVDGIWISPFFQSPQKDFGYDVSDYRAVDPLFGTNEDFDALLEKAHALGLKIIVDLVLSHTSDQHPWFTEKPDYYVWADAKPDDSPPNNWVSVFGGSAWQWHEERGQYYLHNFLKEQPDLNFHNPDVQQEALDIAQYWLEKGVDGFRLDVINFLFHDQQLRDNPPRPPELGTATQFEGKDDYSTQQHIYDKSQPEMIPFLNKFRALMDQYPGTFTVGEIGDDNSLERTAEYTCGTDRLHTSYNTDMMKGTHKQLTADIIQKPLQEFAQYVKNYGGGHGAWAFSNHDVVRAASRWLEDSDGFSETKKLSNMLISLLACLPGTLFLYQGEELGLPEAKLEFEQLHDPWGKHLWPEWQGRDGCRTPMPWDATTKDGWLPIPDSHKTLTVALQNNDEHSTLTHTRKTLKWRKQQPALMHGDITFIDEGPDVLHFIRSCPEQTIVCQFDLKTHDCIMMEE